MHLLRELLCLTPLISERSVLMVEINHRSTASNRENLSHNVVLSTPHHELDSKKQRQWQYTLISYVIVNPTTIQPRRSLLSQEVSSHVVCARGTDFCFYNVFNLFLRCGIVACSE